MKTRKTAKNPTILPPEERFRLETAERLSAMMALSLRLLEDSGMHAALGKDDHAGAVNAAARLIKSNADITHALVRAVQGETRHRSIVEKTIGSSSGLNPDFSDSPSETDRSALEEFRHRIECLVAAREKRENGGKLPAVAEGADDAGTP